MSENQQARRCVLASSNPGKLAELQALLQGAGWTVTPQSAYGLSSPPETGTTFVENAIIKARHACAETGLAAIGDDSGIEVDALDGAPGIISARFAGEGASDQANLEKLRRALDGLPPEARRARFQCVIVLMRHARDATPLICAGTWEGVVASEPRGDDGFGYDPLFYDPRLECTAAELDPATKNRVSHRGQALARLLAALGG